MLPLIREVLKDAVMPYHANFVFHTLLIDNSDTRCEQRCSFDNSSRLGEIYHPDFMMGLRPGYCDVLVLESFTVFSLMRQLGVQA